MCSILNILLFFIQGKEPKWNQEERKENFTKKIEVSIKLFYCGG